jgi:hypothetical protein
MRLGLREVLCGVHRASAITEPRRVALSPVASLQACPAFAGEMQGAKAHLVAPRDAPQACDAEAALIARAS